MRSGRPGRRFRSTQDGKPGRRGNGALAVFPHRVSRPVLSIAALALLALPHAAATQTVRGRVVAAGDGSPVSAAFVSLVDAAGERVDADLTAAGGFFRVEASAAGTYRVRVERIGFEEWASEPLALAAGETYTARYEMRVNPVRLSGLRVRVRGRERACVASPGEEAGVMRAWNEARKALEQALWAEEERVYRFGVREWEKELGPRAGRVLDVRTRDRDWLAATPFRSLPVEELAERGFIVEEADGSFVYYAPDAATLLSYLFVETHCFGLRWKERGDRRFVGLAFEPTKSRRVPEIRGVLWLDEETAELDHLEFGYTNLPFRTAADEAGGRVELHRMPDGGFIVRRWWIRMPLLQEDYLWIRSARGDRTRHRVVGYEEEGAEVTAVYSARGRRLRLVEGALVSGTVHDSAAGRPVRGAVVSLVGASDSLSAVTDSAGRFRFEGLAEGKYRVLAADPRLELLGLPPEEMGLLAWVRVKDTVEMEVRLLVPADEALFRRACPDLDPRKNVGLVAGKVRSRETSEPVAGARVVASWSADRQPGATDTGGAPGGGVKLSATTHPEGRFRICGIPGGLEVSLESTAPGFRNGSVAFEQTSRIVEKHVFLEPNS